MNIPPDDTNDLNQGPDNSHPLISTICSIGSAVFDANREWTSAHDLAIRFAGPILAIAAATWVKSEFEERNKTLMTREAILKIEEERLIKEKQRLTGDKVGRSNDVVIDELMAEGNSRSHKACREVDEIVPVIQEILDVKCSIKKPREQRRPLEQKLRARILSEPSPFDGYGNLKASILEDTVNILEKDTRHCDMPWPLGRAQNGELYKVYRKNWKLEIELAKYKLIVEELKRKSAKERSSAAASEAKRKGSAV